MTRYDEYLDRAVILPGIGGAGEAHWQTLWQKSQHRAERFEPDDWNHPDLLDWIAALDRAVARSVSPPFLIAHSLACLLVAHWQSASPLPVAGAFLVAVPDPGSSVFPREATSFAEPPAGRFRFPCLIVASNDDPYGSAEYASMRARQWGGGLVELGPLGHINGASGLGEWPQGLSLLTAFAAGLTSQPPSPAMAGPHHTGRNENGPLR